MSEGGGALQDDSEHQHERAVIQISRHIHPPYQTTENSQVRGTGLVQWTIWIIEFLSSNFLS